MSVVQLPLRPSAEARARRNRIWNPPNGRVSSELEVVSEPVRRQQRIQAIKEAAEAKRDAERRLAIARELERAARHKAEQKAIRDAIRISRAQYDSLVDNALRAERPPSMRLILAVVSKFYGVPEVEIIARRRLVRVTIARQVVMWLARDLTFLSLPEIGRRLNGRDHTTILHGIQRVNDRREDDSEFKEQTDQLVFVVRMEQARLAV